MGLMQVEVSRNGGVQPQMQVFNQPGRPVNIQVTKPVTMQVQMNNFRGHARVQVSKSGQPPFEMKFRSLDSSPPLQTKVVEYLPAQSFHVATEFVRPAKWVQPEVVPVGVPLEREEVVHGVPLEAEEDEVASEPAYEPPAVVATPEDPDAKKPVIARKPPPPPAVSAAAAGLEQTITCLASCLSLVYEKLLAPDRKGAWSETWAPAKARSGKSPTA